MSYGILPSWNLLDQRKHVELIKICLFLPPKIVLFICTATTCPPSQILILFEIHSDMLGKSSLFSDKATCR